MKYKIILCFIIIIAIFFRFWGLGTNPPLLNWDEVAWGYNAYSIGIDGKDEFGKFLPVSYLESFGDYKPPVYAYLDVLPVKIFGLNAFATRFPSALFGVFTVLATYYLAKRLFYKSSGKEWLGLAASGILAISPWHIMLSRGAFEANVATFFIVCGVWLFLEAMEGKKWYLIFSAISLVLSLYTFNTARIVSPLLVIFLTIIFWKKLWKIKPVVVVSAIIGILILLPSVKFLFSPQAKLRFQEVNIFSDISLIKTSNQEIANDSNSPISKIIHNRRVIYSLAYLKHYFDNLDPNFLFITGDPNPKFSTQQTGELYLWDLPFLIIGILFMFKRREGFWYIVPLWLLLGIIPAATARETPHALRTETTLPTFQIFIAYGLVTVVMYIKNTFKNKTYKKIIYVFIGLGILLNLFYYQFEYNAHYAYEFSGDWNYSYKDSVSYVSSVKNNFKNVYITEALGRPYIYYLFYTHTLPSVYRKTAVIQRDVFGFVDVKKFDKYTFVPDISTISKQKNTLYINVYNQVPNNAHILKTFTLLNGQPSLVAYDFTNI